MNPEIQHLLKLTDEFPTRKRIEFDNPDDCQFIIAVFKALKAAGPAIRQLATTPPILPVEETVPPKTVGGGVTIGQQLAVAAKAARGKRKSARLKAAAQALNLVVPPEKPQP